MNKIKYIFFDMDGTLIDSMQVHFDSWRKALGENGIKVTDFELRHYGGMSFLETIEVLSKKYNKNFSKEKINEIRELKIKYLFEIFENKVKVYDGVLEGLSNLKKAGFKLVLVSGAIRKTVDKAVGMFFEGVFDYIISQDDVKLCKPNPEPYFKAMKLFNAKFEECLVVEDAIAGINAGKAANIKVFALTTTMNREELKIADEVFENHKDLFARILNL